jgi:streptomycin 6-kinase
MWGLSIGRTLPGGTEAFVSEVTMSDGRPAVLKLGVPMRETSEGALVTLLAAKGRGYAEVYAHDGPRDALLLERLGPNLASLALSVDTQIEVICETLAGAWIPSSRLHGLMTGAEKARALRTFIDDTWHQLGETCSARVIDTALTYAERRGQSYDPAAAVVAHGDAHPWNTLLVPGHPSRHFKFVDPEGLFIERGYDLGILMREWTDALLTGDPWKLGVQRCQRLSRLTGVDEASIWEWGFIERTSTALLCMKLGFDGARDMLAVAEAWAACGGT